MGTEIIFSDAKPPLQFDDLEIGDWFIYSDQLLRKLTKNSAVFAKGGETIVTGVLKGFGANSPVVKAEVTINARILG